MSGNIRCNKCFVAINDRTGACPKCGRAQCHIVMNWKGTRHRFFKDTHDVTFSYMSALDQHLAMSRDMREKRFAPADWHPAKVKERRLDMMMEKWLHQIKEEVASGELSYGTLHAYQSRSKIHIVPQLGALDVNEIRFSDIENFKDDLPKTLRLKTKREILNTLHTAMKWLWRKGMLGSLPPFPVVKGNDTKAKIALTMEDQHEALERIPAEHRDVFAFENETGLRPGETCALKIKDIDFPGQTIKVQRTFTMRRLRESDKEGHRKVLPLSARAMELAQAHAQGRFPDDWLFLNPVTGSNYTVHRMEIYWKLYTKLPCTHYEGTRHSFCTQIAEIADRGAAQDLMRHADGRSTDKYIHNRTAYLSDVLAKRGKVSELKRSKRQ